jgi:four helix bundle protein
MLTPRPLLSQRRPYAGNATSRCPHGSRSTPDELRSTAHGSRLTSHESRVTSHESRDPRTRTRSLPHTTCVPFCDRVGWRAATTMRVAVSPPWHSLCQNLSAMQHRPHFNHHKLDCYRVALDMLRDVHAINKRIPRGYRSFADQLLRAAGETVALIGEGANRFTKGQKRQRFTEARGEAGEVAVHVEAIRAMDLICEADAERLLGRADRVCAMLTRLIHIHS